MPHVVSIVYTPDGTAPRKPQGHFARVPLDRAELKESRGIVGDLKGGTGDRQLNVMCAEVVEGLRAEGFKTTAGELGEQIVVAGVDPAALTAGARVRLGGAVIEVVMLRTGCGRFEAIQGQPRAATAGRLGVMARVVAGGAVGVGDAAEVLSG